MNELTLEEKLQSIVGAMDLIAGDRISLDRLEINAADYDAIIGPELAKWPTPSTRVFQKRLGFLMNREIVAIGKAQREVWPSGRVPRGCIWQRNE